MVAAALSADVELSFEDDHWTEGDSDAITVTLDGDTPISAVRFVLEYSEETFQYTGFSLPEAFSAWSVEVESGDGSVTVEANGPELWPVGEFLYLEGVPAGVSQDPLVVTASSLVVNEGSTPAFFTPGSITIRAVVSVRGTVYLGPSGVPLENHSLLLLEDGGRITRTDAGGHYFIEVLRGWEGARYAPAIDGWGGVDYTNEEDAAFLWRYLAGLGELTAEQRYLADVDENGTVDEADSELILAAALGPRFLPLDAMIRTHPVKSIPAYRELPATGSVQTGMDFTLMARGDLVDPNSGDHPLRGSYQLDVRDVTEGQTSTVRLWLKIEEDTPLRSMYLRLGSSLADVDHRRIDFADGVRHVSEESIYGSFFALVLPEGRTGLFPLLTVHLEETHGAVATVEILRANGLDSPILEVSSFPENDQDGDGLSDDYEINTLGTDPNRVDSDGDGWSDPQELTFGSDPADKDSAFTMRLTSYDVSTRTAWFELTAFSGRTYRMLTTDDLSKEWNEGMLLEGYGTLRTFGLSPVNLVDGESLFWRVRVGISPQW